MQVVADNDLEKVVEPPGVLREFQPGKELRNLTFLVQDPALYAIAKA